GPGPGLPAAGRGAARPGRLDGHGPAPGLRPARGGGAVLWSADLGLRRPGLLGRVRGPQQQLAAADALPRHRGLERARGLAAALAPDPRLLDGAGGALRAAAAG